MDGTLGVVIAMLLGAQTIISGIAIKLLLNRLDHQDNSISKAHARLDRHIEDRAIHAFH